MWTKIGLMFLLGIIYHCDLTKEELEPRVFREVTVKGIDASDYQTVQVQSNWSPSYAGLKIRIAELDNFHPGLSGV